MKTEIFAVHKNQNFELAIFSFNSYVYYLTHSFIASTRAFNLPTQAFNLATRASSVLTRIFELVTCGFELVIRRFELITCRFELVTRLLLFHWYCNQKSCVRTWCAFFPDIHTIKTLIGLALNTYCLLV